MRLGSLLGMEIIDLGDASRLGRIYQVDAEIDAAAGRISGLRLFVRRGFLWNRPREIAWEAVRRIGEELLIVDLRPADDLPRGAHAQDQLGHAR